MAVEVMLTIDKSGRPAGATASDAETLAAHGGTTFRAVLTVPGKRSLSQTGLYFAMCDLIADNHPAGLTKENVDQTLRIECGHANVWKDVTGFYRRSPKSIAFNALSREDFTRFLDLALLKAGELFGPDLAAAARAELERIGAPDLHRAANDTTPQERAA